MEKGKNMKIIIFGSTGGTGRQIVKQALEQGYKVTAFARSPEKLDQEHENLEVIKGNVLEFASVERAIQGQDAVLCSLGMSAMMDKSRVRANGTKNIIRAMEKNGVKRLICESALGVGDSYDILPWYYKYFMIPVFLRHVYADHNIQENYIKDSQLDWTIVRPAALTNGEHTGSYQHGFTAKNKTITLKISRADTAYFMLKQLTDNNYLHKTPCIS
jgi:putative NADH-flavin reductase